MLEAVDVPAGLGDFVDDVEGELVGRVVDLDEFIDEVEEALAVLVGEDGRVGV